MRRAFLAAAIAASVLCGCADSMLSDARIRDNTAMALGQPASAVTIANRRYDGATNTYYDARTPRGTFHCLINGGGLLAVGITAPAQCTPS